MTSLMLFGMSAPIGFIEESAIQEVNQNDRRGNYLIVLYILMICLFYKVFICKIIF